MNRRASALLCLVPQLALLALLVVREELALRDGTIVELAVDVSDDWSLYGPSLIDRLAIRRVPRARFTTPPASDRRPHDVFVVLATDRAGVASVERVLDAPPEDSGVPWLAATIGGVAPNEDPVVLEYRFVDADRRPFDPASLPRLRAAHDVRVRARIPSNGRAVALELVVDGVPYDAPR